MPPNIALTLCIFFISTSFIIDIKRRPNVSYALWFPLIWLLMIGSKSPYQWLYNVHNTGFSISEGNPIERNFYLILIIICLFILIRRKIDWTQVLKSNVSIFILLLFMGVSILWSEFMLVSFKRWFKTTGNLIVALVILTENDPIEALTTIFKRCAYVLIPMSGLFIKYYPQLGVYYSVFGGRSNAGVCTNKNELGRLCLCCGFILFWNMASVWHNKETTFYKKEVFIDILILMMISWLLIKANSATSSLSLIVGFCVYWALGRPVIKKNIEQVGLIVLFISFCFLLFFLIGDKDSLANIITQVAGHSSTFYGRIELWEKLINIDTNPIIGTGYGSFWLGDRLKKMWEIYWWHPMEAHNGYLEVYLEMGLIGVFILATVIISTFGKIIRKLMVEFEYGRLKMAFLVMLLIYNITESAFRGLHLMWFIFIVLSLDCPRIYLSYNSSFAPLKR